MEVKVWNAILGNVVKYKALDIFKYFNAFPTSLKAKLCISAMRLLLKSILEMLGIWLNALRSEKAQTKEDFFSKDISFWNLSRMDALLTNFNQIGTDQIQLF